MSNSHCISGRGDSAVLGSDLTPAPLLGLATRINYMPWPCRDHYSGSLYPLPPEQCRRNAFCHNCAARTCIFGGTPAQRRVGKSAGGWAVPDAGGLDLYIAALELYTRMLRSSRTCWHCANLLAIRGRQGLYVCPHHSELVERRAAPSPPAEPPALCLEQARLCTALEGCGEARFRPRTGRIPRMTPQAWQQLLLGGHSARNCTWCAHLRAITVQGRERFCCALQAAGMEQRLVWRVARSWRVLQGYGMEHTWCRGAHWCLQVREQEQAGADRPAGMRKVRASGTRVPGASRTRVPCAS